MNSNPVSLGILYGAAGFDELVYPCGTLFAIVNQRMHKSPLQSQHNSNCIHLSSISTVYRSYGSQPSPLAGNSSRTSSKKVPLGQRDSMDNLLPWALVDEEPEMLISELGLSYYPLHPPTEEEAMNQYSPPSYLTAGIGHGSSVQTGSVAVPSHVHEPFQPQLAPFHDGLFHTVQPSQVSRHHNTTHEPTRQNNIRRRRKIDATERAEIRAYHLEHREFKQQQIAGKRS